MKGKKGTVLLRVLPSILVGLLAISESVNAQWYVDRRVGQTPMGPTQNGHALDANRRVLPNGQIDRMNYPVSRPYTYNPRLFLNGYPSRFSSDLRYWPVGGYTGGEYRGGYGPFSTPLAQHRWSHELYDYQTNSIAQPRQIQGPNGFGYQPYAPWESSYRASPRGSTQDSQVVPRSGSSSPSAQKLQDRIRNLDSDPQELPQSVHSASEFDNYLMRIRELIIKDPLDRQQWIKLKWLYKNSPKTVISDAEKIWRELPTHEKDQKFILWGFVINTCARNPKGAEVLFDKLENNNLKDKIRELSKMLS